MIPLCQQCFFLDYSETREKLEALLGGDKVEYFSSTTDLWSSVAIAPYLGYSIHGLFVQVT